MTKDGEGNGLLLDLCLTSPADSLCFFFFCLSVFRLMKLINSVDGDGVRGCAATSQQQDGENNNNEKKKARRSSGAAHARDCSEIRASE